MAITKIKAIKKRLDHVIDYTTNPSKTSKESYQELHNVVEYVKASYKTEEQLYVTSLNCSEKHPFRDMIRTKRRYSKTDGILGFHAIQSFAEKEVTPEQAHEIGIKLAEEIWGDRFEVIVTTHLNTNHLHNHFVINSVSFKDGKRYYDNHSTYALIRDTSDRLCEEYSLSVIKEKEVPKSKLKYENFCKGEIQKSSFYNSVKEDIDYAVRQAYTYNDFLNILKKLDYETINRSGKLSIRPANRKRNIRIERAFGNEYTISNIERRIFETQDTREPFPEARKSVKRYKAVKKFNIRKRKKAKGIRALYIHYCLLLKIYPKRKRVVSTELREEIKKMEKLAKETRFICSNNIQTQIELVKYKTDVTLERKTAKSKREYLWKKYKKATNAEEKQEITIKIKELEKTIKNSNEKLQLIEDIESRIPKIKETLELEENKTKRKEMERDEYSKRVSR